MTNAVNIAQIGSNNTTFRNRIINGAMVIDQRNAGASVSSPDGLYILDRWIYQSTQNSKVTIQQNQNSVTPPAGFTYYSGITSSSAYAIVAGDYFMYRQKIEGFNVADLAWGTASAATVTLSFWVRSSLTGTFGGSFMNSAEDRFYPFNYTISSANTWEQKTITVAGDTSGTWIGATNGKGVGINFALGLGTSYLATANAWTSSLGYAATGATSVVGTSGATFYITGVQLEVGSSATGYEYHQYGQELALCQRYYWKKAAQPDSGYTMIGAGMLYSNTDARASLANPVVMRTYPAITFSGSGFGYERANSSLGTVGSPTSAYCSPETSLLYSGSGTSTGTAGQGTFWYISNNTSYIAVNAEL